MKQVTCSQMRIIAEEDLNVVGAGLGPGDAAVKAANAAQRIISRSPGCVAGAKQASQGRNPGRWGKKG